MRKRYFDLRPGDSVSFAGSRITVEAKSGARARLCIETEGDIRKGDVSPVSRPAQAEAPAASASPFLPRPRLPSGG